MKSEEQVTFVNELIGSVTEKLVSDIKAGKTLEEWDGHELRHLIAERFQNETFKLAPARMREYRNTVLTKNL